MNKSKISFAIKPRLLRPVSSKPESESIEQSDATHITEKPIGQRDPVVLTGPLRSKRLQLKSTNKDVLKNQAKVVTEKKESVALKSISLYDDEDDDKSNQNESSTAKEQGIGESYSKSKKDKKFELSPDSPETLSVHENVRLIAEKVNAQLLDKQSTSERDFVKDNSPELSNRIISDLSSKRHSRSPGYDSRTKDRGYERRRRRSSRQSPDEKHRHLDKQQVAASPESIRDTSSESQHRKSSYKDNYFDYQERSSRSRRSSNYDENKDIPKQEDYKKRSDKFFKRDKPDSPEEKKYEEGRSRTRSGTRQQSRDRSLSLRSRRKTEELSPERMDNKSDQEYKSEKHEHESKDKACKESILSNSSEKKDSSDLFSKDKISVSSILQKDNDDQTPSLRRSKRNSRDSGLEKWSVEKIMKLKETLASVKVKGNKSPEAKTSAVQDSILKSTTVQDRSVTNSTVSDKSSIAPDLSFENSTTEERSKKSSAIEDEVQTMKNSTTKDDLLTSTTQDDIFESCLAHESSSKVSTSHDLSKGSIDVHDISSIGLKEVKIRLNRLSDVEESVFKSNLPKENTTKRDVSHYKGLKEYPLRSKKSKKGHTHKDSSLKLRLKTKKKKVPTATLR